VATPLLRRGVYLFPLLDAGTDRRLVVLVDRRSRMIHYLTPLSDETDEEAIERGKALLELIDPPSQKRRPT
jgi:hypothetical protein